MFSAHGMLAAFLKIEEIAIDQGEAKLLADAALEVASHYDIAPDPKVMAWMGLFGALGAVYGTRVAAYNVRKKYERTAARDAHPAPSSTSGANDVQMSANIVQMTASGIPIFPTTPQM